MKELSIVGGGLAGLSLGIALREREVPVRLFESGTYPQHKVCGEFICGVRTEVLDALGIKESLSDSSLHETMDWWMGNEKVLSREMPIAARGISRALLDQRLAEKFQNLGGVLEVQCRQPLKDRKGVIWACGKRKSGGREWIGLKGHFYLEDVTSLEMHVGSAGYVGLCPVEGDRVNVCGLFRVEKDIRAKGRDLLIAYTRESGLSDLTGRLISAKCDEYSFCATAGFSLGKQAAVGEFCVGDALNLIPPFTGNGMSMALESSHLAAPFLENYARGEVGWKESSRAYSAETEAYFSSRMKLASWLHPLLFKAWSRKSLTFFSKAHILPMHTLFTQLRTP